LLASFASVVRAEDYKVDAVHSAVLFRIQHMGVSFAYGRFNDISGSVSYDAAAPEKAKFDVSVKAASIDTGNADRDKHLRSADFFEVDKFPDISFKSKDVKKKSDKELEVTGDMTLHGVTKPMTVTISIVGVADVPRMGPTAGFECSLTVKRSDFGMDKMMQGLGDEVTLRVALECHKPGNERGEKAQEKKESGKSDKPAETPK
jgi:polyisoprenoid-binding protein YceI